MQVFELHFNPNSDKERAFDTFVYEPENLYEKRLGSLYMAGELTRRSLGNPKLLNELSLAVKDKYYSSELKKTADISLKDAIKEANDYLKEQTKKGNVEWLGNLNFAILNYRDSALNFTKTGNIKIILVKGGEFVDIGEGLGDQIEAGKTFSNVAVGKLSPGDKIMVLTSDAFSALTSSSAFLSQLNKANDEKKLKEVIGANKGLFSGTSGICLMMLVTDIRQDKKELTFKKELPDFSFKKAFAKPAASLKPGKIKIGKPSFNGFKLPSFNLPRLAMPKPRLELPRPSSTKTKSGSEKKRPSKKKFRKPRLYVSDWKGKRMLPAILLTVLLLVLFAAFRTEKSNNTVVKSAQESLDQAQANVQMGENLLIIKKPEDAKALFQQSLQTIAPLVNEDSPLKAEAQALEDRINNDLNSIPQGQ